MRGARRPAWLAVLREGVLCGTVTEQQMRDRQTLDQNLSPSVPSLGSRLSLCLRTLPVAPQVGAP